MGRRGRTAVIEELPALRQSLDLDFVVVNCENAASGFGVTADICRALFDAGVDVLTTGNHVWDQREILDYIQDEDRLLRPLNFPVANPGKGVGLYPARGGKQVLVIQAQGQIYMPPIDDPFGPVEDVLNQHPLGHMADAIIIDMHAEATSEKMAMGHIADGRASLVVGTHTHVPTADTQILPGGTAYQTDAGMCGDYDSVIGMDKEIPLQRFRTKLRNGRFTPSMGEATICGVFVETGDDGLAVTVEPLRLGGRLRQSHVSD